MREKETEKRAENKEKTETEKQSAEKNKEKTAEENTVEKKIREEDTREEKKAGKKTEEKTEKTYAEEKNKEKVLVLPHSADKRISVSKKEKGIYKEIIELIPKEDEKIKNSLKYSVAEGSANAVMAGFGENYLNPFAVNMNASDFHLSFLESIPQLIASFLQIFSIGAVDKIRNRKKIILPSMLTQAFVWLLMIGIALYFRSLILLIIFATIEVSLRVFIAPAWSSMMSDLVNEKIRGKYFGLRNKIMGFVNFAAILIAGRIVYLFSQEKFSGANKNFIFYGFGLIFAIAFVARVISWYFTRKQYEKPFIIEEKNKFSLWQFIKKMPTNNFGIFVIFMCLFDFSVWLASPFFTVYMLRELGMNFWIYTLINSASTITSFIVMTYWGKYSDIFGNRRIFEITGYLIPLVPVLWIFSKNPYYLICANIFSGFVWAGFNLSSSNYIYDAVTPQKRMRCISYYTFLSGITIFLGAIAGATIISRITAPLSVPVLALSMSKYQIIFLVSGIARLIVILYFMPRIREVRLGLKEIPSEELFVKLIALEPIRGFAYSTVKQFNYGIERMEKIKKFIDVGELGKIVKKRNNKK